MRRRSHSSETERAARRASASPARSVFTVLLVVVCLVLLQTDVYPLARMVDQRVDLATLGLSYPLVTWQARTLAERVFDYVGRSEPASTLATEADTVREFFARSAEVAQLSDKELRTASGAEGSRADLAGIEAELEGARAQRTSLEKQAVTILARQVSWALEEGGLDSRLLGWRVVWPPVASEFVELPLLLIVSPRDRIRTERQAFLLPNLSVGQMEAIESKLEGEGWSALVTEIGGLSTYPAMLPDRYGLGFVLEAMPHEWCHDYLYFRPLGWRYGESGDLTTMNETLSDLVGTEIGQSLARQFYPEMVREPQPEAPAEAPQQAAPEAVFDFGREMRATRLHADELLAAGKVSEAESYMEAQRQVFVQNGYALRKLNQAYFAFHGSYATGEASVDPIGPELRELRLRSASLREFVLRVSTMTSRADLRAALGLPPL
jgi:hypothetical protein